MAGLARIKTEMLDEGGPRPVLLLGAGASVKSGVPSAAGFAEMIARWAYLRDHGRSQQDQTVLRSDWLPWLRSLEWYDESTPPEHQYATFVSRLLVPREARMQFLLERVRSAPSPSSGYVALADLIAKGWVRTVLTTNFDDLVERACLANPSALLKTVRSPAEAADVTTTPRNGQLVFLHGTVEHYTDLNLDIETLTLPSELVAATTPILRDSPLVVLGYRGAEASIMRHLLIEQAEACHHYRHGVYWCVRPGSQLAPMVEELRATIGSNFLLVEVDGFDEALGFLAEGVDARVRSSQTPVDASQPPRELTSSALDLDELDWALAEQSIPACAERLQFDYPGDREGLIDLLARLNLVAGDPPAPTVAGERLLGRDATTEVVLTWPTGERSFSGNVLFLIERLRDALAELNEPYRLKGPKSVDVRAFDPLALKELLVNSLVHHDFEQPGPIRIVLTPEDVTFTSPGGVISTVDPERLGRSAVKGYRNQVLANVLFGTGDMDKHGSGLVDVRRWAQESGADATFSVNEANNQFTARLLARPERPTAPGLPAEPTGSYEVFYVNALPVTIQRGIVEVAPTSARERREIWDQHPGEPIGPFLLRSGSMVSLEDMRAGPLRDACAGTPEAFDLRDYCADPDRERHIVGLLNESLGRHAQDIGLVVDWKQHRLWFPRSGDGDGTVQVSYSGRVKQSTRTVVKVRRSTSGALAFFEHSALGWQFRRFGSDWFLFLLPGWSFTRDGVEDHLSPRKVTSLSTRRAARDYNANVSAHLFFWAYVLTHGQDSVVLADGGSSVLLSSSPLTAHIAGMPPTPGTGEPDDDTAEPDDGDLDEDFPEDEDVDQ